MAQSNTTWVQKIQRLLKDYMPGSLPELEPFQAYELWADTYDNTDSNALLFSEQSAVRPLLETLPLHGKAVLDAGCGAGRYLGVLQLYQPSMIVGVDFVRGMIEKARRKNNLASSLYLQVALVERLPFKDETFDFVLCTLVLGHILDLDSAIAELSRVLRRSGSMIITCFHPYGRLLGWVRSFQTSNASKGSRWYAVKYYRHLHSDYFKAFQASRLEVVKMFEPVIDETLRPFYEQAQRMDLYQRFKGCPLVLIFQVRKR